MSDAQNDVQDEPPVIMRLLLGIDVITGESRVVKTTTLCLRIIPATTMIVDWILTIELIPQPLSSVGLSKGLDTNASPH